MSRYHWYHLSLFSFLPTLDIREVNVPMFLQTASYLNDENLQ